MMYSFEKLGKPIVVASHRRSGTHLTIDLLRKQFKECKSSKKRGERLDRLYLTLEALKPGHKHPVSPEEALHILAKTPRPIVKSHQLPGFQGTAFAEELTQWLEEEADFLYLVRDGRSVMTSLHLYEQSFHVKARVSFGEFIRLPSIDSPKFNNVSWWSHHIHSWLQHPKAKVIKYEDALKQTRPTLEQLGSFFQLEPLYTDPLLPKKVKSIWEGRWSRLFEAQPESTAVIGYYKGHTTTKWQKAFQESDHQFFQQEAGEVMQQLGYTL